jgi:hypothetical protein
MGHPSSAGGKVEKDQRVIEEEILWRKSAFGKGGKE